MFEEYNSCLSIEDNHTLGYLPLQQYPESIIHDSVLLNLTPCELDIKSTTLCDIAIPTYEIELTHFGKKVDFNLLDDEDFTISYITDAIPSLPAGHQFPTQAKLNVSIIDINGEEPIIYQCALDERNSHQTSCGKSKVKISLCRRKSYQITDLENICSRFYQVRPLISHLEFLLPKKPPTPKNIGEGLKAPKRKLWKEDILLKYHKNKNVSLLSTPISINYLTEETKVLCSPIAPSIKEGDCYDTWKLVARHCTDVNFHIKGIDFV